MRPPMSRKAINRNSGSGDAAAMGARDVQRADIMSGSISNDELGGGKVATRRMWRHESRAKEACRAEIRIGEMNENRVDVSFVSSVSDRSNDSSTIELGERSAWIRA